MANLATDLLRTIARAFYSTEHTLVIEALIIHSTLPDSDISHLLSMQVKAVRKLCGRLKEDGLLSVQTRQEKRTDGSAAFYPPSGPNGQAKERMTNKEWYYLNYHRAIDSIKYRMYKLNKHFSSLGMPTMEKKELSCPRCKAQWTDMEVVHKIDPFTGAMPCPRCGHELDRVEEEDLVTENESVKRLNSQLEKVLRLMQQIDATTVPENEFEAALARHKPIVRTDVNPAQRIETVDLPNKNLLSSKGLEIKPEKIAVSLQSDEEVRKANAQAEEKERREREARQNALPDWIAKSTVSGEITTIGAKEDRERKERDAHAGGLALKTEDEEKKPNVGGDDDMARYWLELEQAKQQEAADRAADDEEDEEDDDDFEDVPGTGAGTPAVNGAGVANGAALASTGVSTPALESSNATDDERDAKRPRLAERAISAPQVNGTAQGNGAEKAADVEAEGTPAASDEDEDELEFENV